MESTSFIAARASKWVKPARDDAGLTLIEMMVALVILGLVSSGFAYGLQLTLTVTQEDRARIQATNLAARELETVRNEFGTSKTAPRTIAADSKVTNPHPLPGGVNGQPLRLDGTDFTVVRTVQWLPGGTGTSPCDGGSAVTYPSLGVNVRVSWQAQGMTKDVESNTVLTPPKGTLSDVKGFIAAKVQGADGNGVSGVTVKVSPGTHPAVVTAADGCAVFALSSTGNYSVTLAEASNPGHVSFEGQKTVSKPATVGNGTIQIVPFSYDAAATLELDFQISDGAGTDYQKPAPLPSVVLFNPSLPSMGKKKVPAGQTTVTGLWPFPDGYSLWAGTCNLNDPAASGGTRADPVKPRPGQTVTAPVVLKPVKLTMNDDEDGGPIANTEAIATIINISGCNEQQFELGRTDENGLIKSALPYGQWRVSAGLGEMLVDVTANGSVTYPLELPVGG